VATRTETSVAPALGNGIAYFLIVYVIHKGFAFTDETMAVAMAGAVVSSILFELKKLFHWASDRWFPSEDE